MTTKEASKMEIEKQCDYELVFIVHPEVDEEAVGTVIEGISQIVEGKKGAIGQVDRWGKRRLAYPIKHCMEGSYVLIRFKLNPLSNGELEAHLKISEKILRYLLIKVE